MEQNNQSESKNQIEQNNMLIEIFNGAEKVNESTIKMANGAQVNIADLKCHYDFNFLNAVMHKIEKTGEIYFKYRTPKYTAYFTTNSNRVHDVLTEEIVTDTVWSAHHQSLYHEIVASIKWLNSQKNMAKSLGVDKPIPLPLTRVSATFIGQDGSMGYKNNHTYNLVVLKTAPIVVCREENNSGECVYQSLSSFLKNWTNIIVKRK